jgi:hypothetical protein
LQIQFLLALVYLFFEAYFVKIYFRTTIFVFIFAIEVE